MTQMVFSVVTGKAFGGFTSSDLPSNGEEHKTFPRSLCLTSQSGVQYSTNRVRIMGSDVVGENVSVGTQGIKVHHLNL
jgi:hypothetical protein